MFTFWTSQAITSVVSRRFIKVDIRANGAHPAAFVNVGVGV